MTTVFLDLVRHGVWFAGEFILVGAVLVGQVAATASLRKLPAPSFPRLPHCVRDAALLAGVGLGAEVVFLVLQQLGVIVGAPLLGWLAPFVALPLAAAGIGAILGHYGRPYLNPSRAALFATIGGLIAAAIRANVSMGEARLAVLATLTAAIILSEQWPPLPESSRARETQQLIEEIIPIEVRLPEPAIRSVEEEVVPPTTTRLPGNTVRGSRFRR